MNFWARKSSSITRAMGLTMTESVTTLRSTQLKSKKNVPILTKSSLVRRCCNDFVIKTYQMCFLYHHLRHSFTEDRRISGMFIVSRSIKCEMKAAQDNRQTAAGISHNLPRSNELAFSSTRNLQFYRFKTLKFFSRFRLWYH